MAPRASPSSAAYRGATQGDDCGRKIATSASTNPPSVPTSVAGPAMAGFAAVACHTQPAENTVTARRTMLFQTVPATVIGCAPTPAAAAVLKTDSLSAGFV